MTRLIRLCKRANGHNIQTRGMMNTGWQTMRLQACAQTCRILRDTKTADLQMGAMLARYRLRRGRDDSVGRQRNRAVMAGIQAQTFGELVRLGNTQDHQARITGAHNLSEGRIQRAIGVASGRIGLTGHCGTARGGAARGRNTARWLFA